LPAVAGPATYASLDGEIMPAAEAMIPATDEGLIRGDGVFEVIRVYDGLPFAFEDHLARLERSATRLRLPVDLEAVRAEAFRLLAEAGPGEEHEALRVVITRGGRRLLLTEGLPQSPDHIRLGTVSYAPTRILDGIKSLSYAGNMLASRIARENGYDEALLVTPHGRVLEAPTSSIFWVSEGALLTPPLSDHILASITRAAIFEVSDAVECACTLEDLRRADEVFLASTTREVQAVVAVDEFTFEPDGPITVAAAEALRGHIAAALARA
jgi:branched-chain amino acid aminotransferase